MGSQRTASYIEVSYDDILPLGGKEAVELLFHRICRETVAYRKYLYDVRQLELIPGLVRVRIVRSNGVAGAEHGKHRHSGKKRSKIHNYAVSDQYAIYRTPCTSGQSDGVPPAEGCADGKRSRVREEQCLRR